MIQQICPNCLDRVDLADDAAGTTADCPKCGKPIAVPASYQPSVDPGLAPAAKPAPPPGFRPSPPPSAALVAAGPPAQPAHPAEPPPAPVGYENGCAVALAPTPLAWTATAFLTLALALTFFSWVGSFPGGYRAFTQTPWQAVPGWISMQANFNETYDERPILEAKVPSDWGLLVPYLGLLIAAVVVGWLWLTVPTPTADRMPKAVRWLPRVWPAFPTVLMALAVATLVLMAFQMSAGFGLETAVDSRVEELVDQRMTEGKPAAAPESRPLPRPFLIGEMAGRYDLRTTTAFWLAVGSHVLAVLAMAGWLWLRRRGSKPSPRILAQW